MQATTQKTVAVILAGAVARGAFEAGALRVLADANVRIARIVCASSGALNGAFFAAAVRARRERTAAADLVALWRDHAGWSEVIHVNLSNLVHREGMSDQTRLRALLREQIRPTRIADPAAINLRIIVAPLDGVPGTIEGREATTYEQMIEFEGAAFDDAASLEQVFTATVASSSFPFLFAPTEVPGLGRCVDGGAVNNTPIKYALDGAIGAELDAVVVISPTVERVRRPGGELHGMDLLGRLVDLLINERLYRDLREAVAINASVVALEGLTPGVLDAGQLEAVKRALGWERTRSVEIIQIRPLEPLPGTPFSALHEAEQRIHYIQVGIERAEQVLADQHWR